jgi:iron(III) transport system permease protein
MNAPSAASVAVPPARLSLAETLFSERGLRAVLLVLCALFLCAAVLGPLAQILAKSLQDRDGLFIGLANFRAFFDSPSLSRSLGNSLFVSVVTTVLSVTLGFAYAYGLTRVNIPGKGFLRGLAMAPLFAPTLLYGINLIYLFGRKGLITTGFFGALPLRWDIGLYGPVGIIISETIFTFPQVMLIVSIALRATDARLYEAARTMGAGGTRLFFTVTLPGVRFGLLSAAFVSFILCFTDFGAPKVVGGQYNVLATDIYKQVIGQQNFSMGATVSVILLIPTLLAFLCDRLAQKRQAALIVAKSVPLSPSDDPAAKAFFLTYCSLVALALLVFLGTGLYASLVTVWPYNLRLSLAHYHFGDMGGGGYGALWGSLRMSLYSAVAGTAATFFSAYLIEKTRGLGALRQVAYFLSMIPLALPGLVIGLSYIFFFNAPGWSFAGLTLPNPLHFLYATMGILVLSNVAHFYSVAFLTATTALKQLDKEYEAVSESLGVSFFTTLSRVTIPVCLPAILEIGQFYFVSSMATVSAVIFLYSADLPLASVAVANMDDAGDIAPAAAMSVCIVLVNIAARLVSGLVASRLTRRAGRWMGRQGT